jgi:hypothetical protein
VGVARGSRISREWETRGWLHDRNDRMSRRGRQAYWARHSESQSVHDRWVGETLQGMPVISYAARHAPGATFPAPEEVAWIAERRALLPEGVKGVVSGDAI